MIRVICKSEAYTYNVYHIVKAFFPSEEIISRMEEEASCYIEVETAKGERILIGREQMESILRERAEGISQQNAGGDPVKVKELKYGIDICLYHELEKLTGRSLDWGILTGVRPTKIAMQKAEEGWEEERFVPWFQAECKVSERKARLSWEIAKREKALLGKLDYEEGYSLYVGIPFCPSVCTYCSFSSGALDDWADRVEDYLGALKKELVFIARQSKDRKLNTIYIGGGTPTTLKPHQLDRLLTCLKQSLDCSALLEFTVEAGRPDSINKEKLEVLRAHGISRISINPQTMKQETLDLIGRRHTTAQTVESFHLARSMGFTNINMDLIMGLPQETLADVRHTLEQLKQLTPDSITVHSLAVKRAARLQMFKEDYAGLTMINTQEHLDAAAEACASMGMVPYYLYRQKNMAGNFENVGYAKEGKAGIYNVLIMEEKQTIVALGAGSISKRVHPNGQIERCENVKDVSQYIERIGEMIERKRVLLED